jgi:hypothetical protein
VDPRFRLLLQAKNSLEQLAQENLIGHARTHAAGVNELAVIGVVAQQQRS